MFPLAHATKNSSTHHAASLETTEALNRKEITDHLNTFMITAWDTNFGQVSEDTDDG